MFGSSSARRQARLAGRHSHRPLREDISAAPEGLLGGDLLAGMVRHVLAPAAPSLLNPKALFEKALIPVFTLLAAIFLFIGLWRFAEATLGPVHTPFLFAILMGLCAVGAHLWLAYQSKRQLPPSNPLFQPQMLLSLAQLWLAPKGMRRTMLAGMALNWVNRKVAR